MNGIIIRRLSVKIPNNLNKYFSYLLLIIAFCPLRSTLFHFFRISKIDLLEYALSKKNAAVTVAATTSCLKIRL